MTDLDAMHQYVEVRWSGHVYKLRQLAVMEKDIIKRITNVTTDTSLEVANETLEFICGRFKESDNSFDEKKFKTTATFEMVNEVMRVLMAGDKSSA